MFGRATASQIASASLRSFLLVFTYGLTNCGAMSLHLVAQLDELARPVVRAAAGFHPDQAGRQVGKELQHLAALQLLAQHRFAALITPWTWNTLFARSIPTVVIFMADAPSRLSGRIALPLWRT